MDRFSKFHPAVCLFFFLFVIVITLVYINPVHAALSLVCALLYSLRLLGVRRTAAQLKFSLPLILIAALFNMLFCRYGQTVLFFAGAACLRRLPRHHAGGCARLVFRVFRDHYKRKIHCPFRQICSQYGSDFFHGAALFAADG